MPQEDQLTTSHSKALVELFSTLDSAVGVFTYRQTLLAVMNGGGAGG